ncbi:MAG: hypothetical protein WD690_01235 [Vicinamibacterales bacterium]
MKKTLFVFAAVTCLVSSAPAAAQSPLADAARREAARRSAVKAPTIPVYTNDDLSRLPPRPTVAPPPRPATVVTTIGTVKDAPGAAAPAAAAGQPAAAPGAGAARDEKYWRQRITGVRNNLSRAEMFAEALQSRINALSADIVNRDDPAQRQVLVEQRQKALDELARVQDEIAAFIKEIADIEAEARRLNVPPGWLR